MQAGGKDEKSYGNEEEIGMKRFHVHISVQHLKASVRFYSRLFGTEPTVQHVDYAKWMLEDPRMNFAISQGGEAAGVNHLGFQLDSTEELQAMRTQLQAADAGLTEQKAQACCYARSDKYWVTDPTGIAWETFHTLTSIPVFCEAMSSVAQSGCCIPVSSIKAKATTAPSNCCTP